MSIEKRPHRAIYAVRPIFSYNSGSHATGPILRHEDRIPTRIRKTRVRQVRSGLGVRLSMLSSTSDAAFLRRTHNLECLPSVKIMSSCSLSRPRCRQSSSCDEYRANAKSWLMVVRRRWRQRRAPATNFGERMAPAGWHLLGALPIGL